MVVCWVVSIAGFATVAKRTGVLAAFGPSVVIVAESPLCIVGSKGGKGAPIRIMIPSFAKGAAHLACPVNFKRYSWVSRSPQLRERLPAAFRRKAMS